MSGVVVLDTGIAGLLAWRTGIPIVDTCRKWQMELLTQGVRVVLPEIVDYEVRRELVRLNASESIARFDRLALVLEYAPLTTAAMRLAAALWGHSRQQGYADGYRPLRSSMPTIPTINKQTTLYPACRLYLC